MWVCEGWDDYELLDAGYGEKLERWGEFVLRRPDPQAIWPADKGAPAWAGADAVYRRSGDGGGHWEYSRALPPGGWAIGYRGMKLSVKPMQFKHTGVFPEQSVNWDWISGKIESAVGQQGAVRVLNLFAYTGAATVAAASAGARVCHVDAARGMVAAAKQNAAESGVPEDRIRYIVDDVYKFVKRELRRGAKYDAILMDPPAYGRGPGGELWKLDAHLYGLVEQCAGLLADKPLFFLINSYAAGYAAESVGNVLKVAMGDRFGGRVACGELGIRATRGAVNGGLVLPCGCCARWESGKSGESGEGWDSKLPL